MTDNHKMMIAIRNIPFPPYGLYVITRDSLDSASACLSSVAAALEGGAAVVQYRAKSAPDRVLATELLALCHQYRVPLIINDDVELAGHIGADGVHLGQNDLSVTGAIDRLGCGVIVGVSCYDSLERAETAQAAGADYVAFGRFFASASKPHAPLAHLDTLSKARERLHLPIVAIGGIDASNGARLLQAGAMLLAVIEGVLGQSDPLQAARILSGLVKSHYPCPD